MCIYCCRDTVNPNAQNIKKIADLYAEVVGVLSQSRFHSICRRFFQEIKDPQKSSSLVVRIIEGLSFMRVKMFPVEELELWFRFLLVMARGSGQPSPRGSGQPFICVLHDDLMYSVWVYV